MEECFQFVTKTNETLLCASCVLTDGASVLCTLEALYYRKIHKTFDVSARILKYIV